VSTQAVRTRRQAAIDIGTNTTLLLVGEQQGDAAGPAGIRVLVERAEITRLGRGIGKDGRLGAVGIEHTLRVLEDYAAVARAAGAPLAAVGTEGLRRASNAQDFLEPAGRLLGTEVEVISGDREAALTFRAAVTSFPELASRPLMVIDIGGGSTEVIVSDAGVVSSRHSLPLGSVRLTERHLQHDPPAAEETAALVAALDAALAALPAHDPRGAPRRLVGTAGTVTTLAAMALGLRDYDAARVHGYELSADKLGEQVARLASSTQSEREQMTGLDPRRADVIYAGACILRAFVQRLGAASVLVNDRGIRWGLLYERLGTHPV
jgi:exopolyphosphatase / guanosine-5'-triphosphate,3'-diphosphate pyrophosphatase